MTTIPTIEEFEEPPKKAQQKVPARKPELTEFGKNIRFYERGGSAGKDCTIGFFLGVLSWMIAGPVGIVLTTLALIYGRKWLGIGSLLSIALVPILFFMVYFV
ncbi:MAG: hypothetical protein OXR66_01180 [Candidatus Woesearchaeota archaeon]|nr:hypothetical protein [Candidatus Woesearchaeota archaeon]